ncbi:hypothetical protein [Planctomicrobium sp. SH664]|uniref:hypothetical protein n=1 Tax=Planctomicrobium sp. SH664 TaxID=3448125 RepID=UPI003F5B60AD
MLRCSVLNGNCPLDLTAEFRLRRWARLHHVPVVERDGNWHPVILNEMLLRDFELEELRAPESSDRIVPLEDHAAAGQESSRSIRIDGAQRRPHSHQQPASQTRSEFYFA